MSIIALEGNIGVGKSTLCDKLLKLFPMQVKVFKEDIEGYKELVKLYYEDPVIWTAPFQQFMINRKLINSLDAVNDISPMKIIERTISSNRDIFALEKYESKVSSDKAWREYSLFYNAIKTLIPKPDLYIYLKATAPFLYSRVHRRNRPGESNNITLDYLQKINRRYNTWIEEKINNGENVKTIQVDHDFSDEEIKNIFINILEI